MDTQPIVDALHAIADQIFIWGAGLMIVVGYIGHAIVTAVEKRNKEPK